MTGIEWGYLLQIGAAPFLTSQASSQYVFWCQHVAQSQRIEFLSTSDYLCIVLAMLYIRRRWWHPTPVLLPGKSHGWRSLVGCSPWGCWGSDMTEWLHFTFHSHALKKEMATHSSVLAWRIPGTEEPGARPSMGSHRVGHDWSDLAAVAAADLRSNPSTSAP